jgi:membrane dipeptidase
VTKSGRSRTFLRRFVTASLNRLAIVTLCTALSAQALAAKDDALEHARKLLRSAILLDGHNDLPWAVRNSRTAPMDVAAYDLRKRTAGQTDIPRLREGGISAQFWSVYVPGEAPGGFARTQLEQIDIAKRIIARYPDTFRLALTAADVRAAKRERRIASLLGMEGGHVLENSLGALRSYYDLGARYMTLTHNTHTDWADSAALPPTHGGLTGFGEQVVLEMNRLGMLVDLSHVAPETMDDALRVAKAPIIFSHSSARGICDVPRNVPDDILKRLPANGGVVMVTFVGEYIDPEIARVQQPLNDEIRKRTVGLSAPERQRVSRELRAAVVIPKTTVARVADHIDHVRKVAGVEHVGIGGDFDGASDWPEGLSDVSMYPNLFAELIRRGWTDRELKFLAGENVLRVLEQAEKVAHEMTRGE